LGKMVTNHIGKEKRENAKKLLVETAISVKRRSRKRKKKKK